MHKFYERFLVLSLQGTRTFYNRIVIVGTNDEEELVLVRCQHMSESTAHFDGNDLNSTLREKRDVLPAGFREDP